MGLQFSKFTERIGMKISRVIGIHDNQSCQVIGVSRNVVVALVENSFETENFGDCFHILL